MLKKVSILMLIVIFLSSLALAGNYASKNSKAKSKPAATVPVKIQSQTAVKANTAGAKKVEVKEIKKEEPKVKKNVKKSKAKKWY